MDTPRIADLLQPFLKIPAPAPRHSGQSEESAILSHTQLQYISTYIDLLLRWNARVNLTAIRQPEEIVTRHFGESLFAASHLFPGHTVLGKNMAPAHVIDVGSGAGFPGFPIKIWAPDIHLTLIESTHKKATFLREVARALTLMNINVFSGRAEDYPNPTADVVTLRAVERFEANLPRATRLVAPAGRLALLITEAQLTQTYDLTPGFKWASPVKVPLSSSRVLVIGVNQDIPN